MKTENKNIYSVEQIRKFFKEVQAEFSKIAWPTKKITMSLTVVVVVLSIIVSIYLGTVDLILGKIISSVLK